MRTSARHLGLLLAAIIAGACSRDLSLPVLEEPGPGSVSGQVVYAVPGRFEKLPAGGAHVVLLGSGLETNTNPGGGFTLEGVEDTEGVLLIRFDSDGDGVVDRQRALQLADFGTGPHKRVNLGTVALGENASVHGRALRKDVANPRSGHGGTSVFVPEGPFATTTSDDGTYTLPNLPEGPLQFFVFRAGYLAVSLGTVTLRSGEDFGFRDVVLEPSNEPQTPGSLTGRLYFIPEADVGDATVFAQTAGAPAVGATVGADLSFHFPSLEPGLYSLGATRSGYTPVLVANVLVLPGKQTTLGAVVLTNKPALDAGSPTADAGWVDGGVGSPCASTADCAFDHWCDDGMCRRQCSSNGQCTNGRFCEPQTRTCLRPCSAGCSGADVCDTSINACRRVCDGAFPCPTGFVCDAQSRCVPECLVTQDCQEAHRTCQAGQCVFDMTCDDDLDCPKSRLCLLGSCVLRPTALTDGGTYACPNGPCDCRLDEWCRAARCEPSAPPTLYFSAQGTGDGHSSATPSKDLAALVADAGTGAVLALLEGDTFAVDEPLALRRSRTRLSGGYRDCGPRWVRGDQTRTTLTGDAGTLVAVGPSATPLLDVEISGLSLAPQPNSCYVGMISASDTRRLSVHDLEGDWLPTTCYGSYSAIVYCQYCEELSVGNLTLGDAPLIGNWAVGVWTSSSNGRLFNVRNRAGSLSPQYLGLVVATTLTGPLELERLVFAPVDVSNQAVGVNITGCGSNELYIHDSTLAWPHAPQAIPLQVQSCSRVRIENNLIDGDAYPGGGAQTGYGMFLQYVGGTVTNNRVVLPSSGSASQLSGILVSGGGPLSVTDNVVVGGHTAGQIDGLQISGLSNGPSTFERNWVDIGPSPTAYALMLNGIPTTAGLTVRDSFFRATGDSTCTGTIAGGYMSSASALVERCRLYARQGGTTIGLTAWSSSQFELYASHLWAGGSVCAGDYSAGLFLNNAAGFYARGNTIDGEGQLAQPGPSYGLYCQYSDQLYLESNIVSGGRSAAHATVITYSPNNCLVPERFSSNYFWYQRPQVEASSLEEAWTVLTTDAGVFDLRGNIFMDNVVPYDPTPLVAPDGGPLPPRRLSAQSACIDRGALATRLDTSVVDLDLDGRPRDGGAGPDIGCCER